VIHKILILAQDALEAQTTSSLLDYSERIFNISGILVINVAVHSILTLKSLKKQLINCGVMIIVQGHEYLVE
jgi:hypothetical protein